MSIKTPETEKVFNAYKEITAEIYGVSEDALSETFMVAPRIAQKIEMGVQQTNAFLKRINFVPVREVAGDVLRFGVPSTLMKRTNTDQGAYGKRRPSNPNQLLSRSYSVSDYESDPVISWNLIDSWAHLKEFYPLWRQHCSISKASDYLKVMWNGQFSAANTDPNNYPELQDVKEGFIQRMIKEAPEQVLGITPDANADFGYAVEKIKVGEGGDFKSLDELMYMLRSSVIHKTLRKSKKIKALIGDDLVQNENRRLFGSSVAPTERLARELYLNTQAFGLTEFIDSDEYPDRGIFIGDMSFLNVYYQKTAVRRKLKESHEQKGVIDYEYGRFDMPITVPEGIAVVHPDAIQIKNDDGNWVDANSAWKVAAP